MNKSQTMELFEAIQPFIQQEVECRIKEYPVLIRVDGRNIDIDDWKIEGGQIEIDLKTPLSFWGRGVA